MRKKYIIIAILVLSVIASVGITFIGIYGVSIEIHPLDHPPIPFPIPRHGPPPYTEMEGIIKVKTTEDYSNYVKQFGEKNVSVTAVRYKTAHEAYYLPEIDPHFTAMAGCIIVLYAGDTGYVYQLDVKQNIVYRMPIDQFKTQLQKLDWDVVVGFYQALTYK